MRCQYIPRFARCQKFRVGLLTVMRPECSFVRRRTPKCPVGRHGHFITLWSFHCLPLLTRDLHCRRLLDAMLIACRSHNIHLCAYVFMPDHVHALLLPGEDRHNFSAFEATIRAGFAGRMRLSHGNRSMALFRVRANNGDRAYQFLQITPAYEEIVTTEA